jgi:predicted MPP superfamily phosphohydrolase
MEADCFAITGDIGEARSIERYLRLLESSLQRPIYFVLGNHDFYHGSIVLVRERVRNLCKTSANVGLNYLRKSALSFGNSLPSRNSVDTEMRHGCRLMPPRRIQIFG